MNEPIKMMVPVYDVKIISPTTYGEFSKTYTNIMFKETEDTFILTETDNLFQVIIPRCNVTVLEKRLKCRKEITGRITSL